MITTPGHSLTFGAVDLLGDPVTTAGGYWFEAAGEDTDLGNPEPVEKAIASFLQDGAIAAIESYDNREMPLKITVKGVDSAGLAAGEAALMGEVAKRNTLTWTPPDKAGDFAGVPSVFDVVTSWLDHSFDDINELNLQRTYTLTIKALPFARSNTLTTLVSPAPPSTTPVVTVVDACTSTTGWSNTGSSAGTGAAATGSGDVYAVQSWAGPGASSRRVQLNRTGLSASGGAYIRIVFTSTTSGGGTPTYSVAFNGGAAIAPTAASGNTRWYYFTATVTSVAIAVDQVVNASGTLSLYVSDISRSNMPQDQTGARQSFRSLAVAGSARTQGNLALEDPGAGLGSALVYTSPNAGSVFQPPLRAYRTASPTETTDSTMISGKYNNLSSGMAFEIPAPLVPSGSYLMMARVQHPTGGTYTLSWQARTKVGTTISGAPTDPSGSHLVTLSSGVWATTIVGAMVLPIRQMGSAGYVRLELSGSSGGLVIDEVWLFNLDIGRLTWVECGSGTPATMVVSSRLFLDAASLDSPVPSVWLGTAANRSDSFGAATEMKSFGEHEFIPPSMNVFTVTSASVATQVTLSYYKRAHTHMTP